MQRTMMRASMRVLCFTHAVHQEPMFTTKLSRALCESDAARMLTAKCASCHFCQLHSEARTSMSPMSRHGERVRYAHTPECIMQRRHRRIRSVPTRDSHVVSAVDSVPCKAVTHAGASLKHSKPGKRIAATAEGKAVILATTQLRTLLV